MWDKDKYITDTYISRINGAQMVNMGIDAEAELTKILWSEITKEANIGGTLIMSDAKEDRRKYLLIRR
jgi:hypothetical protein